MKKLFLTLLMLVLTTGAFAQVKSIDLKACLRGDFGLGVGTTIGLGSEVDIAPSINFILGKPFCFSVDADFHYNIGLGERFNLYPLAGPTLFHFGGDKSVTKVGINLGAGLDFALSPSWALFAEGKYQFLFNAGGYDKAFLAIGAKYRF